MCATQSSWGRPENTSDSDDIIPNGKGIIDVLLCQRQGNVGRVILPFFRLLWLPETESESPRNTHIGVG